MAEIDIFTSMGEPFLSYNGNDVKRLNSSKDKNMYNLYMDGIKFYAKEKGNKSEFICYFRAQKGKGQRADQFMAVYKGDLESPREFADQVEYIVDNTDQLHAISGKSSKNILAYLDKGLEEWPEKYNKRKIARELKAGEQLVFETGQIESAVKFLNALFELENQIGDDFSVAISAKKKAVKDAEIVILLDDSVRGITEVDDHAQENDSRNNTPAQNLGNRRRKKPSGPLEWIKSILPF